MNILDRYIGQSVITGVATVLTVLIVIYELIEFAGETSKIGRASYTIWSALQYSLLRIPQHIYELFPLSMLLGSMLGLGWLANNNELVIIRMAGVSLLRIIGSIMKTAIMLMLVAMVIGEGIAPPLQQYATDQRIKLLNRHINLNTDHGLWARDGNTYVNINRVDNTGQLIGITLYQFSENNFLEKQINARKAIYDGEQWILKTVVETIHKNDTFTIKRTKEMKWKTLLDLETVKIVAVRPELLSIWKLDGYIKYLKNNDLEYTKYELVYWTKIFGPLTILAMVLLSIPFVFGSVRHVSIGRQILLGFLVGITFYIVSRLVGQVGLVYGVPPLLSALLPNLLVISLTIWSYRRIR